MPHRFLFDVQMRFGDEDRYQHVNNVTYLRYLEDARVHMLAAALENADDAELAGKSIKELEPEGSSPMVGAQNIEYLRQLGWQREPLRIQVWVSHIGASSYSLDYLVGEGEPDQVYARARTLLVQVDKSTGRPVRLPAEMRSGLEEFVEAPLEFRRRSA